MSLHPWVSTVTYLTSRGPPTLVYEHTLTGVAGLEGDAMGKVDRVGVIWPTSFKHMSFDGRFLHGGVGDLCPEGDSWPPKRMPTVNVEGAAEVKRFRREEMRITFLVNVWLNHKPFAIERCVAEYVADDVSVALPNTSFIHSRPPPLPFSLVGSRST